MEESELKESGIRLRAEKAAETLMLKLGAESRTVTLAESCTAGLVSSLLAGVPGASGVLWGSFVCYTEAAKISMLGIDREKLQQYGLVSREAACFMAEGALQKSGADIAAAVTGLAGPDGDGSGVAVGTVWIATAARGRSAEAKRFHFTGSRNEVRLQAAASLIECLQNT